MEPNENQFSYFHPQYHHHSQQSPSTAATVATTPTVTTTASPTNGILPNTHQSSDGTTHMVYPHSVPSAVKSQPEPSKRKRGRPRKYFTPEQALAAKKAATASSLSSSSKDKKVHGNSSTSYSGSSKKSQLVGNGQRFTPYVIDVNPGEDVRQKIMMFMQQCKREICILSALGTVSSASLCHPATSGGHVIFEGCYKILQLSGSYVRTEHGGRSGGLSVSLCSNDGQIYGGGVCGPLKASSAVQVIVATFLVDTKKDVGAGIKVDESASKISSSAPSFSNVGFHSTVDASGRNPNHQAIGVNNFMIQSQGMHMTPSGPSEWRTGPVNMEMTGRSDRPSHQSTENGSYDQIHD